MVMSMLGDLVEVDASLQEISECYGDVLTLSGIQWSVVELAEVELMVGKKAAVVMVNELHAYL